MPMIASSSPDSTIPQPDDDSNSDTKSGETTPNITDCIGKLEMMFVEALESSTLSTEQRLSKKEAYMSLTDRIRNNIPAL